MKKQPAAASLKTAADIMNLKTADTKFIDVFTPCTIKRFTGHLNGAIYGSPDKIKNGKTPVENLFICGTDQGFLGITGAMLSGISIANMYAL
jgi:phytoene dehydrogenase-like protein